MQVCTSSQTTTPTSHHSVFYRPDALPATQPTASKHWGVVYLGMKWLLADDMNGHVGSSNAGDNGTHGGFRYGDRNGDGSTPCSKISDTLADKLV